MNKLTALGSQSHGRSLAYKRTMRLTLEVEGLQQKAVACDLSVDGANLSRYLADSAPDVTLPIHRLLPWYRATGDLSLLRQIAGDHGYDLLHSDDEDMLSGIHSASPQRLMALLSHRSGNLLGRLIQALEDGDLTDRERAEIHPEALRLLAVVQSVVDRLDPRASAREVS